MSNARDADGTTALQWAVQNDDLTIVQLMLRAGADARLVNRYDVIPLSLACLNGSAPVVRALLDAGADPSAATAVKAADPTR